MCKVSFAFLIDDLFIYSTRFVIWLCPGLNCCVFLVLFLFFSGVCVCGGGAPVSFSTMVRVWELD